MCVCVERERFNDYSYVYMFLCLYEHTKSTNYISIFDLYSVQSDVEKYVLVNDGMFAMPFVESWVQFQMLSGSLWRAGSSSKCYLAVCGELGPVPNAIWPLGTVQHAIHSVSHTFVQCCL